MIPSTLQGNLRTVPPVARSSVLYLYDVPVSSTTVFVDGSRVVAVFPEWICRFSGGVVRQIFSTGGRFQSAFERGGLSYGGGGSLPIIPMEPVASISRIPLTAASAVIPPPPTRHLSQRL